MLRVTPGEDSFDAVLTVAPSLTVLADHFPQQAILPGICMMQAVLIGAETTLGVQAPLKLQGIKNAKLVHPLLPGDQVAIAATLTPLDNARWQIKARLTLDHPQGRRRVAEFSMQACLS